MKVLAICGSPRKGNTEAMLRKLLDGAKGKGAGIELVLLRDRRIELCDGCDSCFGTGKGCHVQDDMQALYGKLFAADVIVLGSPNYFSNCSALMKLFVDRLNPYCSPGRLKGKKAGIVCVGGQELGHVKRCEAALKLVVSDLKMDLVGSVVAKAEKPGKIRESEKVMQQCFALGEGLAAE